MLTIFSYKTSNCVSQFSKFFCQIQQVKRNKKSERTLCYILHTSADMKRHKSFNAKGFWLCKISVRSLIKGTRKVAKILSAQLFQRRIANGKVIKADEQKNTNFSKSRNVHWHLRKNRNMASFWMKLSLNGIGLFWKWRNVYLKRKFTDNI